MRIFTTIVLLTLSIFAKAQTFSWSGNEHIADMSTVTVPINVTGLGNAINSTFGVAHICLYIEHSYDADLTITLQSPSGTLVTLLTNTGGAGNNFTGTCLGMDGVSFLIAQPPYTGLFFPAGEINSFNNGQNPNGTWTLSVTDVSAPDTGTLLSASIEFTNNPPLQPGVPGLGAPVGTYLCGTCTCPEGQAGCDLLPDMTASYKEINQNHTEEPGVLYISNATPNIGSGPLDIFGIDSCFCGGTHVPCNTVCPTGIQLTHVVKQRIYQKVPGKDTLNYYDRFAGTMTFHPQHGHIHVDNWANYTLRTATSNPDARTWPIIATGTKQSFCLVNLGNCANNPGECVANDGSTVLTVPNSNLGWHTGCNLNQGIYPGMYDVYSQNLNDPMPLLNVCNGNYYIVSITDPDNQFLESDKENNWIAVPITLTQQNVTPVITPGGSTVFCPGGSVTLTSSPATNYLWSTGETTQSITVTTAGTYTVSSNCGAALMTSQPITTSLIPANSTADVAVAITSGDNPTCPGSYIEFHATAYNGGSNPVYQWKVNGNNVGTNSPVYATNTLTDGQVVTCTLTSNISCLVNPVVTSAPITMTVISGSTPTGVISISNGTNPTCPGSSVTFTANVPGGTNPSYQWKVNGSNVGTNSNTYTTTTLTNGQQVSCVITANNSCSGSAIIGTSTTVNDYRSDNGVAYPTYYGNGRQQYLISAAELNAQGFVSGKINSISFNVAGGIGDPSTLNGYTIKIAQVANTALAGAFLAPAFTTVFGPVNYTPTLNSWNRHQFSTPFDWDGTSSVLIDICFSNQVYGNAAYTNYQSDAAFTANVFYQADLQPGAGACTATTVSGGGTKRPNMKLDIAPKSTVTSNIITMTVNPSGNTYTFTGSGNWNVASNWANNTIPPSTLGPCGEIIVDPVSGNECILNVQQTVMSGAKITVKGNKKFRVMGNLTIIQ
ncbi:MAG: proprotein convertase P-domain-containing protein [Bacteroidetes bacterium]|nr:proprotein convertase P-domain-containing protein [Bacteroidota bacterium]